MSQSARILLVFAGLSLSAATGLGAYASHGAAQALDPRSLESLRTAIEYEFYNSLGLLGVALLVERYARAALLHIAGYVILAGTVVFCGAVYARVFGAPAAVGHAAPFGGSGLIVGWLVFAIAIWRCTRRGAAH
jgi:uncharacterized membrane protein YgdD (TMEM256/DUF423 family)